MIPGSKGLRFVLHKKESRLRDSLRRARVAYATIYFSRECASLAERFYVIGNSKEFPIT